MEYSFYDFLKLIGSLGLFLYGMKIMSEGLQKVAGDRLRSILTAMTTNRVTGVLTGVLITALIQSSSATTVMARSGRANAAMSTFHFWPLPFRLSSQAKATANPSVKSFSVSLSYVWDFLT